MRTSGTPPDPAVSVRRSTHAAPDDVLSASDQRADTLPAGFRIEALSGEPPDPGNAADDSVVAVGVGVGTLTSS